MPENKEIFPRIEIIPNPLRVVGRAIRWCVEMHQLSTHGDHFQHEQVPEDLQLEFDYEKL